MSGIDRQNKLIAAEDWKKIYQSFKNADFQSYDFDNLRRTMITYLRENYPEDFNDYIESSEYLALIDLIAFLGQNLAFRFDLNARDNFLELAERRESVLRLARLVSYSPKRNQCANGLLKFSSISTTETILDSNGRNLANQTIIWNDPSNANWYEQFIKVMNCALTETNKFGKPQDKAVISGIKTEQYRFTGTNTEVPLYAFNKSIDGRNMNFEVVSSSFKDADKIYEEAPYPGSSLAFLYRDDGAGAPSSNTGFFAYFRQGSLQESTFKITRPSTNETVDIDAANINNEDVWLYSLDSLGLESDLWTQVASTEGNNVIYNSISKNIRNIYSVLTRTGDRIRLMFADGVFGNLPQGLFKAYYRTSNGLSYSINPTDIRNVTIKVPYNSKSNSQETLTIALSLKYTVNNSSTAETSDDIKNNAPATYYTQGRMITGEDYNVLPLSVNQEIVKVKAINRVSSGISRYFDLKDTSGKYSTTNLFGTDGIIYKEHISNLLSFTVMTKTDIEDAVLNKIEPLLTDRNVKDFYLDQYKQIKIDLTEAAFYQKTAVTNMCTGTFGEQNKSGYTVDPIDFTPKKLGTYTISNYRYIVPGAMLRFVPPSGYVFTQDGKLRLIASKRPEDLDYKWVKVVQVTGDGTAGGAGVLDNGLAPVILNDIIPSGARLDSIMPKFVTALDSSTRSKVIDLIFARKNFALRYDIDTTNWKIVSEANIDKKSPFSLGKAGDQSNQQLDSSWVVLAETDGESYSIVSRGIRYVFESEKEIRFFFDSSEKVYDTSTGKIIRDKIAVLGINPKPAINNPLPFGYNLDWEVVADYKGADGYVDTKKISISFYDSDEDGVVDNPEMFTTIVDPTVDPTTKIIFQKRAISLDGAIDYYFIKNENDLIKVYQTADQYRADRDMDLLTNGQLVFVIAENYVKTYYTNSNELINTDYRGFAGRSNISFHYVHAANSSARLDPAATNIIDVYMLTKSYDTLYRRWLANQTTSKPLPPSSDALFINFGSELNKIKAISDEVIYHPVKYKTLFGTGADASLQATFKVVKTPSVIVSDNDVKSSVITAINEFFAVENWDFGDTFYFSELTAYIMQKVSPSISNIVIVPKQEGLVFGSLYEIKSTSDEIFASSATVNDIEIIPEITASRIKATGTITTNTTNSTGNVTSS
jgi:hypothetical protein